MNHQINIDEAIAIAIVILSLIILRYDNEFIPVVKNIIADFNLTNNIKS